MNRRDQETLRRNKNYPGLGERINARRAVDDAALDLLTDIAEMCGGPYEEQGTVERAILWRTVFDLPQFNSAARNKAWLDAYPIG